MHRAILLLSLLSCSNPGWTQFRVKSDPIKYEILKVIESKPVKTTMMGFHSDPVQSFRYQSPALASMGDLNGKSQFQSFWINNVTTQSYGNGKFGTYYYWDVQGNLQGSRGFIDISGKNKRGVKLMFPWR
jgi:hypothetical protein